MPSNSFISRCPDDILLTIFSYNLHISQPRSGPALEFTPLTLIRFASQVCSSWRLLVLGSSLFWGKLLHLNDLDQKNNHWREEVLLRTGQAGLSVKVILDPKLPRITSFFFRILDEEWPRIQDLDVSIFRDDHFDDDRWLAIQRPTEMLRSLHLHFQAQAPKPLQSVDNILFSDHAPSLRFLTIRQIAFQLPVNWFSQLQGLHLKGQFLPHQLLLSFSHTIPILESLSVHGFEGSDLGDSWPNIQFPQLQVLVLGGHLAACLKFLEHITAPEGCSLSLSTFDDHFVPPTSSISRVLSRFQKYRTPFYVELKVSLTTFAFSLYPGPPTFDLTIGCGEPFLKSRYFEAALGCPFSQVTCLNFELQAGRFNLLSSDSNFLKFIASFSSVTELVATAETLQLLVQVGNGTILPALKVLRPFLLRPETVGEILIFLDCRQAAEVPLKSLDLRDYLRGDYLDFSELERFSGMTVEWTTVNDEDKVYICGSGNAQELNFSTPPPVRGSPDVDDDGEPDSDDSFD